MYLKKLQVYGFKSFANQTEFVFNPGVTAIVGPNGVGKSNFSDAIKWALGEQSAKSLRGAKMEDIIFNGAADKEPVNFAEVSLTLSNHSKILPLDYEEVTIARRLFRSGESEYLLNKTPVRLKDISELLMGTGIGTDNYFLMEQGQIDLVLSSRPEERRAIFEEASGITKYKAKKKEALNKMEQTEANLLRLSDILSEAQRQINSIERQAAKARRHQKHFQRLKGLEIKVSGAEREGLEKKRLDIEQEINILRQAQAAAQAELEVFSQRLKLKRQELEKLNSHIAESKNNSTALENAIFRNKERVRLNKERIEELKAAALQMESQNGPALTKITELKKQTEEMAGQIDLFLTEKAAEENGFLEKQNLLSGLEKSIQEAEAAAARFKNQILERSGNNAKLKGELSNVTALISALSNRLKRLSIEKNNSKANLSQARERAVAAENEAADCRAQLDALASEALAVHTEMLGLASEIDALNKDYGAAEKELAGEQSKAEILRAIVEKREGFPDSVRMFLSGVNGSQQWHSGVYGALADLITTDYEYEHCIETIMASDLQAVVVEDVSTAKAAVAYLKESRLAQVKFLILSEYAAVDNAGRAGEAVNFVRTQPKYQALLSYILKDINIIKDGDFIEAWARGSIIAGRFNKTDSILGLIGRKDKLENTAQRIQALSETLKATIGLIQTKTECINRLKARYEELNQAARKQEILFASANKSKEGVSEALKRLQDEASVIDVEMEDSKRELERLSGVESGLKGNIAEYEKELSRLEESAVSNEAWIQINIKEKELALVEVANAKTKLQSYSQRQQNLNSSLSILKESLKREELLSGQRRGQIDEAEERVTALKQEIGQLLSEADSLAANKDSAESRINEVLCKSQELAEIISKEESEYETLQKDRGRANSQIHTLEMQAAEISFQKQRLEDRLSQAYKIDLGSYKLLVEKDAAPDVEGFNLEQARIEIEELKAKLDSIGSVNLDAVGEEKELQDRFNFMSSQRADLLKAKDALLEAISKINKTTKEMFLDTFNKAQVEFKAFFKALFGGGDAELFLTDQQDVLESGIEIVARPPGKRLENISLLSGGEKTMTALALLFAVFKVKPGPFCLMDEMDAPLDEANIGRFSRVLEEFTKTSQFIIITHNKKTIALADTMYGITMEESGVSKIVSVRFKGQKKSPASDEAVLAANL